MEGSMTSNSPALPRHVSRLRPLANLIQPVAAIVSRLVIGWSFFLTGKGKLANFENTAKFFGEIGIPMPRLNAGFIGTLEMVGGLCLILGLGTRVFAALLSCTMVVALMTADRADLLGVLGLGPATKAEGLMDVTPIPFLLPLLWLVAYGAGKISADRIVFKSLDKDA
jgi:putative oxidoreductase